jgi:hypothetical protein
MVDKLQIAQTKLITPQRRKELLSRPRLLDMMSDLLDFRLIIIAAPAGYGKTSLLIDFASQFDWPVCWYALDTLDQDFERFLNYFLHSIQLKFPEFGEESLKVLESSPIDQINPDFLISTITNDIYDHITEHFVVVLDDYHLLKSNPVIDQFLNDFIQRADDNCHIVITSRKLLTFPDLPLMVARSQVGGYPSRSWLSCRKRSRSFSSKNSTSPSTARKPRISPPARKAGSPGCCSPRKCSNPVWANRSRWHALPASACMNTSPSKSWTSSLPTFATSCSTPHPGGVQRPMCAEVVGQALKRDEDGAECSTPSSSTTCSFCRSTTNIPGSAIIISSVIFCKNHSKGTPKGCQSHQGKTGSLLHTEKRMGAGIRDLFRPRRFQSPGAIDRVCRLIVPRPR